MPPATRELDIYRRDAKANHKLLTPAEREKLIAVSRRNILCSQELTRSQPYLPTPPTSKRSKDGNIRLEEPSSHSRLGLRRFLRTQLHALIYALLHTIFSVYIRLRQAYHAVKDRILAILYYHHRTPELIQKDVKGLSRLPQHLSVILKLEDGGRGGAGLEALVNEVAEIAAWCACVGIPVLSVYEQTGP
jgi:dehydrodolichyl diphosphate syntase complex subunit NUS1